MPFLLPFLLALHALRRRRPFLAALDLRRRNAHFGTLLLRALELADHPFFVATLFQPERAALEGRTPPLVRAFVLALRPAPAGALS